MKYIKIHMTVVKKKIIEPIVSARDHRTASVLREATPTVLPLHLGWVDYYILLPSGVTHILVPGAPSPLLVLLVSVSPLTSPRTKGPGSPGFWLYTPLHLWQQHYFSHTVLQKIGGCP